MYIESLHYKNIGPLSDLNIQFRKNEKGVPIPLVVVGKNGSGKCSGLYREAERSSAGM